MVSLKIPNVSLRMVFKETVTKINYDEFSPGLLIDVFIIDCKSRLAVVSHMTQETVMNSISLLHPGPIAIDVHKNKKTKFTLLLLKCFHYSKS